MHATFTYWIQYREYWTQYRGARSKKKATPKSLRKTCCLGERTNFFGERPSKSNTETFLGDSSSSIICKIQSKSEYGKSTSISKLLKFCMVSYLLNSSRFVFYFKECGLGAATRIIIIHASSPFTWTSSCELLTTSGDALPRAARRWVMGACVLVTRSLQSTAAYPADGIGV